MVRINKFRIKKISINNLKNTYSVINRGGREGSLE